MYIYFASLCIFFLQANKNAHSLYVLAFLFKHKYKHTNSHERYRMICGFDCIRIITHLIKHYKWPQSSGIQTNLEILEWNGLFSYRKCVNYREIFMNIVLNSNPISIVKWANNYHLQWTQWESWVVIHLLCVKHLKKKIIWQKKDRKNRTLIKNDGSIRYEAIAANA